MILHGIRDCLLMSIFGIAMVCLVESAAGAQVSARPTAGQVLNGMVPAKEVDQTASLVDLEGLAMANNPTLVAAQALVRQEEGLLRQVGFYPNPALGYLRSDPDKSGQSQTNGVFVSQEIVMGGKLRLNRSIERNEVQWRIWQLRAQRERVLNDVRIRYYATLGAQEMMRAAEEFERLAEEGVKLALQLQKANQGSRRSDRVSAKNATRECPDA